jgi:hypothetical protein
VDTLYILLAVAGGLLFLPIVTLTYLAANTPLGLALVAVGLMTLARWATRLQGSDQPRWLFVGGTIALAVAVGLGALDIASQVATALGAR